MWLKLVLLASLSIASCLGLSVEQTQADGLLKVLISGERRIVIESSDFLFERKELKVLCRSMSLPTEDVSAERLSYNASDAGESPVLLNLTCSGSETDVDQCSIHQTTENLGLEYNTVTLSCRDLDMKLMYGSDTSGIVVAKQGDEYYPICTDMLFFNSTWARAVCLTLGLPSSEAVSMYPYRYYNYTPTYENRVKAAVQMQLDCPSSNTSNCRIRTLDSGEYCRGVYVDAFNLGAVLCTDTALEYRRTNMLPGDIGRLEIKVGGKWGAVCFSDNAIAEVACRSLNLPSADARTYRRLYNGGDITLAIHVGYTYCQGSEPTLTDCELVQFGKPCPNNRYLGLSCGTADEGKVRVDEFMGGEVQVYYNQSWWGVGVNSSSSSQNVATVICRSLNMSTNVVKSSTTRRNRALWLPNVQCDGSEANLFSCQDTDLSSIFNSTSGKGLVVTCDMGDEDIRLQSDGLLEIRHNGIWGTMCAKGSSRWTLRAFKNSEASVICKSLGKPSTLASAIFQSNPSDRTGPVWLNDFACNGFTDLPTSWKNCSHGDWGDVNCGHNDDVFIKCEELDESSIKYRLSPSQFPYVGVYEMSLNGVWGTICRDFRLERDIDPKVLCRSLNKPTDGARMTNKALTSLFEYKSTNIWLDFLNCTGSEISPLDCQHWYIGDNICFKKGQVDSAGVYCGPPQDFPDFTVRLVDGPSNSSGRLEMMLYGQWGAICDRNLTKTVATNVCDQLGLSTYMASIEYKKYKQGTGKIWNLAVECVYSYRSMDSCSYTTISESLCDHSHDVGIQCKEFKFSTFSPLDLDDNVGVIIGSVIGGTAAVFIIGIIVFLIVWRKHYRGRTIQPPVYATPAVAYMPATNGIKMPMEGGTVSNSQS